VLRQAVRVGPRSPNGTRYALLGVPGVIVPFIGLLILVAIFAYAFGVAAGRDEERRLHDWGPR
jgi:membrane-bound metal-dependent hydrolase YbcI (DUF457 family)